MTQVLSRFLKHRRHGLILPGWPSLLLVLVFVMVSLSPMSRAFSQQPVPSTPTPEQVIANWTKLEAQDEALKSYRNKIATYDKEGKQDPKLNRDYTIKRQPNYRLLSLLAGDATGVMAFSPRYAFAISKTKPTSPWLLQKLQETPDITGSWVEKHGRGISVFVSYPLSALSGGDTVASAYRRSNLQILRITAEGEHRSKVEVDWKFHKVARLAGTLIIDNRYLSVVLEAQFAGIRADHVPTRQTLRRELYPLTSGRAVPECKMVAFGAVSEDETFEDRFTYSDYSYADLPEEEFRLSHYGLPEPVGTEPIKKGVPVNVWVLGAAVVLAILALVFRWLFRRRASKEPTP